jgi:hypothetical protein
MIQDKIRYRRMLNQWCIDCISKWVKVLNNLDRFFGDHRNFDNSDSICNNFKCIDCPYYKHWTIACIEEGSYFDLFIQTKNPAYLIAFMNCMIRAINEFRIL